MNLIAAFLGLALAAFPVHPAGAASLKTLSNFNDGGVNGAYPMGAPAFDNLGNLYGTASGGGPADLGSIFRLEPPATVVDPTWKRTTLATFNGTNGAVPMSGLIRDSQGNFYGTTKEGGASDKGTVFQLTTGGALVTLFSFNGKNGAYPRCDLVLDKSGNIYGTTPQGGAYGYGAVFKLKKSGGGWKFETLVNFNKKNGAYPIGGLVIDKVGRLLGTTSQGGILTDCNTNGCGTLFMLTPPPSGKVKWTLSTIHQFGGTNGSQPQASMTWAGPSALVGTTTYGGVNGYGTFFQLSISAKGVWALSFFSVFGPTKGSYPVGRLVVDKTGNIYGTTSQGGSSSFGTLFKLTKPKTGSVWLMKTLVQFDFNNGANPFGGLIIDKAARIYGTAEHGGSQTGSCPSSNGCGSVFSLTP